MVKRERDRQTDRRTDRQTDREKERERDNDTAPYVLLMMGALKSVSDNFPHRPLLMR